MGVCLPQNILKLIAMTIAQLSKNDAQQHQALLVTHSMLKPPITLPYTIP